MDLTAPITNVLEFFLKRKGERRERIANYLDSIAADARAIAEIWCEILNKYNEGIEDPLTDKKIHKSIADLGIYTRGQVYRFYKLDGFYKDISKVIGGTNDKIEDALQVSVTHALGSILQHRSLAKHHVDLALARVNRSIFLDETNYHSDVKDIEKAVQAIQKEGLSRILCK